MASNADFVQYIIDQCSGAGEIAVRKMMGDYCAYCNGILFGLICDNNFYVKVTEPGKAVLIKASIPALPEPKAKKKNPLK
ncbi:MAG: TfoX/Sxy family protein [Bacteroidales bacterium]|nr:TfoX/Sxy family protein [Bacteroidales bacterium]